MLPRRIPHHSQLLSQVIHAGQVDLPDRLIVDVIQALHLSHHAVVIQNIKRLLDRAHLSTFLHIPFDAPHIGLQCDYLGSNQLVHLSPVYLPSLVAMADHGYVVSVAFTLCKEDPLVGPPNHVSLDHGAMLTQDIPLIVLGGNVRLVLCKDPIYALSHYGVLVLHYEAAFGLLLNQGLNQMDLADLVDAKLDSVVSFLLIGVTAAHVGAEIVGHSAQPDHLHGVVLVWLVEVVVLVDLEAEEPLAFSVSTLMHHQQDVPV